MSFLEASRRKISTNWSPAKALATAWKTASNALQWAHLSEARGEGGRIRERERRDSERGNGMEVTELYSCRDERKREREKEIDRERDA
jgi:hypothetical protein